MDALNVRYADQSKFHDMMGIFAMRLWLMDQREAGASKEDLSRLLDVCLIKYEAYMYSPYLESDEIPIVIDKMMEHIKLK